MSNTPYTTPQADVTPDTNNDQTYNPKLFSMKGRIGRVRYLAYSFLAFFILYISFAIIFGILTAIFVNNGAGFGDYGSNPALIIPIGIFYIAFTFLYWVLLIRRLNDMNMTGWLSLLMLIPLVNVILGLVLIFYLDMDWRTNGAINIYWCFGGNCYSSLSRLRYTRSAS